MARNRSTNRRRRRGRFSFLTKLLCILLIAGAVVAALTVFFKVQSITVSGNARYTSEEVVAASGIEIEDNLFLLNKYSAAQAIFEKLPYVEEATINRALPDTIVITARRRRGSSRRRVIGSSAKTESSSSRLTRCRPAARASRASSRSRPR